MALHEYSWEVNPSLLEKHGVHFSASAVCAAQSFRFGGSELCNDQQVQLCVFRQNSLLT